MRTLAFADLVGPVERVAEESTRVAPVALIVVAVVVVTVVIVRTLKKRKR